MSHGPRLLIVYLGTVSENRISKLEVRIETQACSAFSLGKFRVFGFRKSVKFSGRKKINNLTSSRYGKSRDRLTLFRYRKSANVLSSCMRIPEQ